MTEGRLDPRHSAAFQRGYDGDVPPSVPLPDRTPAPPALQPTESSSPHNSDAGDVAPSASPEETETTSVAIDPYPDAQLRYTAAHRRFRAWTVALLLVGVGLVALSFVLHLQTWGSQSFGYESDSDGNYFISSATGRQQVDPLSLALRQYLSVTIPWVALVGFGTIVAAVFRAAGRR